MKGISTLFCCWWWWCLFFIRLDSILTENRGFIRKIDDEIQGFQQYQLGRGKFGDVAAISGQGSRARVKGVVGYLFLALLIDKFSRVYKLKAFF